MACVLRSCGAGAKAHNRGRRFWTCPQAPPKGAASDCPWVWEDGTPWRGEAARSRSGYDDDCGDYYGGFEIDVDRQY